MTLDLYYTKHGTGDMNILLIHGFASSSKMWDNIIKHSNLSATWWAVDLPGFGQSPAPEDTFTIDDHVQAVIHFMQSHDLKPEVIMCHSTGGAVVLKLVVTRPDLVQRMVLISPVVTGEFTPGGLFSKIVRSSTGTALLRSAPALLEMVQKSGIAERFTGITGVGVRDETVKQQMVADFHAMNAAASIETLISLAQNDMTPFLADIRHTTLLVLGAKDMTVPFSEGKTAALYMPHAAVKIFDDAYHLPHEEHPQEFAALVSDFLAKS
ncbi:MAG: alpha/beta hydrolase [Anaerolineae bacterium]|nr:alpha/beta hydrolase [Anaerolineae bacterium]